MRQHLENNLRKVQICVYCQYWLCVYVYVCAVCAVYLLVCCWSEVILETYVAHRQLNDSTRATYSLNFVRNFQYSLTNKNNVELCANV